MLKGEFYLLHDHNARRRTMFIATGIGASVGLLTDLSGASFTVAAVACVASVGLVEITRALMYAMPDRKAERAILLSPARRQLLRAAFSTAALLILSALRIPRVAASAVQGKLQHAATEPTSPQNVSEAAQLVTKARAAQIKLSPHVVDEVGRKFIDAGKENEASWKTALELVDYRSFLNADLQLRLPPETSAAPDHFPYTLYYGIFYVGDQQLHLTLYGWVPIAEAAVLEKISGRSLNVGREMGNAYVRVDGNRIRLDGMRMKHIIFANCDVYYLGGPVQATDVLFINCQFEIVRQSNGQDFAKAILSPAPTTNFESA